MVFSKDSAMEIKVFYSNNLILRGKDNGKILTDEDLSLDLENPSKEILIRAKTPTTGAHFPFFFVKFVLTNSLPLKKFYRKRFSQAIRVFLTTELGTHSISSDEDSYQDDFFVGVFYTGNIEYINSLLETDFFQKKFILIPRNIEPGEELNYNLKIELLDLPKIFFRQSSTDDDYDYQQFVDEYYNFLSSEYPIINTFLQSNNYYPLFSENFISGETKSAKNYFFAMYPLTGIKINRVSGMFDSYYKETDNKLLNYNITRQGNFVGTKFILNFVYDNLLNKYLPEVSVINEQTLIWEYISELIYLTLLEISKPLTFSTSGFVPTSIQDTSEKLASTYVYLLGLLSSGSTVYEVIESTGEFLVSSRALNVIEKHSLYTLLFAWANIYSSFLKKLIDLGLIVQTESINSINIFVNDTENINNFLNNYKNVAILNLNDENINLNELTITALLTIYAYALTFDNRNIYSYTLDDTFKYAASLVFEILNKLVISTTPTEIDANNYLQSTLGPNFVNGVHSEVIKQKLIAYTLLDVLFSEQIDLLTRSFLDYVLCGDNEFCPDSKEQFKEAVNVDDDIVNLFNSYVETYSCLTSDSQNLIFVKRTDVCTSDYYIYKNIDDEFFNLWIFLQNINYKVRPQVLQIKAIFGML
jgi:hypothetical protein